MSKTPFQLSRATVNDIPEIVKLEYRNFTDPFVRECFMAADTPEGHESLIRQRRQALNEDPCDYWIKVIDTSTGRIIAASNWKIYAGCVPELPIPVDISWLTGESLERVKGIWAALLKEDRKTMTRPCLCRFSGGLFEVRYILTDSGLNICFTDVAYQRQGAGNMMMKWGCELADHLFLPIWLSASSAGAGLYSRHDFHRYVDTGGGAVGLESRRMLREARDPLNLS